MAVSSWSAARINESTVIGLLTPGCLVKLSLCGSSTPAGILGRILIEHRQGFVSLFGVWAARAEAQRKAVHEVLGLTTQHLERVPIAVCGLGGKVG